MGSNFKVTESIPGEIDRSPSTFYRAAWNADAV